MASLMNISSSVKKEKHSLCAFHNSTFDFILLHNPNDVTIYKNVHIRMFFWAKNDLVLVLIPQKGSKNLILLYKMLMTRCKGCGS